VTGFQIGPSAIVFDLDGTLIDSMYQHVLAWQEALTAEGNVSGDSIDASR
jgi:beta-phosphoglucomutase-like phosphatase (HAD superfamily)